MNLLSRLRQIVMVGSVESLGVAAAGVTGLLIVNALPKEQYAAYTFLITCMQLMMGIADLGLSNCALPIVGQRNNEKSWVVGVCRQIFHRRWLLLILGVAIVGPYAGYSFWQHQWIEGGYLLAAALMFVALLATLRGHYANGILVILGQISAISRIGFSTALTRFALVGAVLLLPINALTLAGVFLGTVTTELINLARYRRAFRHAGIEDVHLPDENRRQIDKQIIKIAVPLVPSAIFFQIQGVVTIFIVSLFGTTEMLADIGAFGRLAIVLTIVDRMASILLFPVIARAPTGARLISLILRIHFCYLFAMGCVLLSGWLFPEYWIILLGQKYANLTPYVWMMFLSSILMNAAGFAFLTMSVRGLTTKQAYSVVFVIAVQVLYLSLIGISDFKSVLVFSVMTCMAHFIYQYFLLFLRLGDLGKLPDAAQ